MADLDLYTVNIFQVKHDNLNRNYESEKLTNSELHFLEKYQNMTSAKVIKGKMIELEHSNLAGPSIKFKTVVNYEQCLNGGSLGLNLIPQQGYIAKQEQAQTSDAMFSEPSK